MTKTPKKIKICVIGCRFNHNLGGRVVGMWRYLAKRYNVQIHIITTDRWIDTPGDSRLKNSKNLKVHKLFTIGAKHGQFKHAMPGLFTKLLEIAPNIIYAQEEPIQCGVTYPAALMAKVLNKPFVFYTLENIYQKWFFPINKVEKFCFDTASLILANTEDSKRVLLKKGVSKNKIEVIPETGIDTQIFKPKKRKMTKTLLYIGRLVPEKGINVILKARQILINKGLYYKYLFIGKGPLKDKLENLAKKNKDIILEDYVPYEKIQTTYHKGDILLYASLKTKKWIEQYGYSMVEALSSGVPVISTRGISGPEAIVNDEALSLSVKWGQGKPRNIGCGTGFLIKEGSAKELAARIEILLEDEDLYKQMSKNARKDAITRLSKEVIAKRTYELFKKVIKREP